MSFGARACALLVLAAWPGQPLDDGARAWVQAHRAHALEASMHAASDQSRTALLIGEAVALVSGPAGRAFALESAIALVPVNAVVETLKWCVNRTRPDGSRDRKNSSFPSSHAANAAALAWILAKRWPRASALFWIAAAAVAWSRIYLNRHFLSDVLVGVMIGVASSWVMSRLAEAQAARTAKLGGNRDGSRRV